MRNIRSTRSTKNINNLTKSIKLTRNINLITNITRNINLSKSISSRTNNHCCSIRSLLCLNCP